LRLRPFSLLAGNFFMHTSDAARGNRSLDRWCARPSRGSKPISPTVRNRRWRRYHHSELSYPEISGKPKSRFPPPPPPGVGNPWRSLAAPGGLRWIISSQAVDLSWLKQPETVTAAPQPAVGLLFPARRPRRAEVRLVPAIANRRICAADLGPEISESGFAAGWGPLAATASQDARRPVDPLKSGGSALILLLLPRFRSANPLLRNPVKPNWASPPSRGRQEDYFAPHWWPTPHLGKTCSPSGDRSGGHPGRRYRFDQPAPAWVGNHFVVDQRRARALMSPDTSVWPTKAFADHVAGDVRRVAQTYCAPTFDDGRTTAFSITLPVTEVSALDIDWPMPASVVWPRCRWGLWRQVGMMLPCTPAMRTAFV